MQQSCFLVNNPLPLMDSSAVRAEDGRDMQDEMHSDRRDCPSDTQGSAPTRDAASEPRRPGSETSDASHLLLRRLGAFSVDLILPLVLTFPLRDRPWALTFFAVMYAVYHGVSIGATGRTLGKALFGLRLRQSEATLERWVFAFARPTLGYATTIFSGVGLVQILVHPRHRALHDFMFSTEVEKGTGGVGVIRRLDEWTRQLDETIEAALERLKRVGRLIKRLAEVAFYVGLAFEWHRARATPRGVAESTTTTTGTSGAVGAGASGVATQATTSDIVAVGIKLVMSGALTVASVMAYDSVMPRPLRVLDRTHRAVLGGTVVYGDRVIVIKDTSGSMSDHQATRDAMIEKLKESGILVWEKNVRSGGVSSGGDVVPAVTEAIATHPDADTVYFFSDFADGNDSAAIEALRDALGGRRLYLGSVEADPGDELKALAKSTDGGAVEMTRRAR